jgi:Ca-activated chloride channel family protein
MAVAFAAAAFLSASTASAQGLLTSDKQVPGSPIVLLSHRATVDIENHVAITRVEQIWVNQSASALGGEYVLPLPKDAVVRNFTLDINGKLLRGEVADPVAARKKFRQLVFQTGNVGLLEYANHQLIRVAVGELKPAMHQRVVVNYVQPLTVDRGLAAYELPLRSTTAATAVRNDLTVAVKIKAPSALGAVYSPTHEVRVRRPTAEEASLSFERGADTPLDRDFRLFYQVTDREFGLNVVAHRPDPKQPGTFMMLLSPKADLAAARTIKRDIVFALDVSGSMRGEKIEQAKNALRYCVNKLGDGDRFGLIDFAADVSVWKEQLVPADDANRKAALERIDGLQTRNGTNIHDALVRALSYPREAGRPMMVVFLTDGLPTNGVKDPAAIAEAVRGKTAGAKVFCFGVGHDVDTHLLDGFSSDSNGATEYVAPGEDIEVKVGRFFAKVGKPVLADPKVIVEGAGVKVSDVHPQRLPDLFAGGQVTVFGRYEGSGPVKVTLTGDAGGKAETFTYEAALPAAEARNGFVEPLWAQRKVGVLLDALRRKDDPELRDAVVKLAVRYGIQTPYTSLIAEERLEQAAAFKKEALDRPSGAGAAGGAKGDDKAGGNRTEKSVGDNGLRAGFGGAAAQRRKAMESAERLLPQLRGLKEQREAGKQGAAGDRDGADAGARGGTGGALSGTVAPPAPPAAKAPGASSAAAPAKPAEAEASADAAPLPAADRAAEEQKRKSDERARSLGRLQAATGEDAVRNAGYLKDLQVAEQAARTDADIRVASGLTFVRLQRVWIDERFSDDMVRTQLKFGSEGYFRLIESHPELLEAFKLGNSLVLVTAPGKALVVGPDGEEDLTDAALAALFTAAEKK